MRIQLVLGIAYCSVQVLAAFGPSVPLTLPVLAVFRPPALQILSVPAVRVLGV